MQKPRIKKESEEEDDPGLGEFVKVTPPGESDDGEDKVLAIPESTGAKFEETESENERPPPPYSSIVASSSGRKEASSSQGPKRESENERPKPAEDESDFHVRMPGSFHDSGSLDISGQGTRRAHFPRSPHLFGGGGWADLMRRLGIQR
jgi:hypothetical protein